MNFDSILLWGFIATLVLTTLLSGSQGLRLTRMSLPIMLGSLFTGEMDRVKRFGFVAHVANGWVFSIVYALAFESLGSSSWYVGAGLGVIHGLFMLVVVIPLLPSFHPRMAGEYQQPEPTALLEPPGFLALNYGSRTPLITLAAHVAYGVLIGIGYQVVP